MQVDTTGKAGQGGETGADVVGIFPNEQSIIRLIGAILLEQNDEWQLQSRYMQVEAITKFNTQRNKAQSA